MAASVNKVIIVGRLGADPEMRHTAAGQAVTTIRVATNEWAGTGDSREERTEWHRVVAWGKLAETCGEYLKKGRQIYVEGRLKTRSWDDRDGNKRYSTEIVAHTVQFLDAVGSAREPADRGSEKPVESAADTGSPAEDDFPF